MSAHRNQGPAPPEASPPGPDNAFLGRLDPEFSSRAEGYSAAASSLETRGPTSQKRPKQTELSFSSCLLKDQLATRILKLDPDNPEGTKLAACHTLQSIAVCKSCNTTKTFWNRCERRYCPICARRLARERRQQFEFWFRKLHRPKFLTLTMRNTEDLADGVSRLKKAWQSLRRSKLFEPVKAGLWSIEVTNQGRGWHVHLHAVIEAPFLPQDQIEKAWSKRIGQEQSIVHIKQLTGPDGSREALKYSAKPTEMVNWSDKDLLAYLAVVPKLRLFGVWGKLHGERSAWSEWVADLRAESTKCECGCNTWRILDQPDPKLHSPHWLPPTRPPPPAQPSLGLDMSNQQAIQALSR